MRHIAAFNKGRLHAGRTLVAAGWAVLVLWLLLGAGCRSTYYSVMERFGKHKRDLLRDALHDARAENQAAAAQFKDALTQLRELTGFQGGELGAKYDAFKGEYDACVSKAGALRSRVNKVERVAGDLFAEWEKELPQIQNPTLRASSQAKLDATKVRYGQLHESLARSVTSMEPVLAQMQDYVLYLKHNLNAQAIGSLKNEVVTIEQEIGDLIESMSRSIQETESFLSLLGEP